MLWELYRNNAKFVQNEISPIYQNRLFDNYFPEYHMQDPIS